VAEARPDELGEAVMLARTLAFIVRSRRGVHGISGVDTPRDMPVQVDPSLASAIRPVSKVLWTGKVCIGRDIVSGARSAKAVSEVVRSKGARSKGSKSKGARSLKARSEAARSEAVRSEAARSEKARLEKAGGSRRSSAPGDFVGYTGAE
jgi:hypothetical protein